MAILTDKMEGSQTMAAQVVTLEKVIWAIDTFEPYKITNLDGIPEMLQEGGEETLKILTSICRRCIAINLLGYTILQLYYRERFRSPFLERLLDHYIRQNVLTNSSIHRGNMHTLWRNSRKLPYTQW